MDSRDPDPPSEPPVRRLPRGSARLTAPADILLFSYGTLRQEEVQRALFGRALVGTDDAMIGYRMTMIEVTDPEVIRLSGTRWHPAVEENGDPAAEIAGVAFRITADDLARADAYEVDYQRVAVRLKSGADGWVYRPLTGA